MTRFPRSDTYDLSDQNVTVLPDDPNNMCLQLGPAGSQVVIYPSTIDRVSVVHSKGSDNTLLPGNEEALQRLRQNPVVC